MMFLIKNLYECFVQRDAKSIDINPLVLTEEDEFKAANVKVQIDSNSTYRQQELLTTRDQSQLHRNERHAYNWGLCYRHYEGGNIGCISNGSALCLAMNDLIIDMGGKPANFLDLGGQVIHEQIREMLNLMEFDSNIKVIYLNVFGGMVNNLKVAAVVKRSI